MCLIVRKLYKMVNYFKSRDKIFHNDITVDFSLPQRSHVRHIVRINPFIVIATVTTSEFLMKRSRDFYKSIYSFSNTLRSSLILPIPYNRSLENRRMKRKHNHEWESFRRIYNCKRISIRERRQSVRGKSCSGF